jgi:hypothetical protein
MRVNGNVLQPVIGALRFAIVAASAAIAVEASNALKQNAHVEGAIPDSVNQSTRVNRFGADGLASSFCAMKY